MGARPRRAHPARRRDATVTETTVVLIAHDGEWTRRRIGSLEAAQQFGHRRSIPVYEVARVGYPKRMREYTERKKRGQV